jgi:hypothetical protein
MVYDLIVLVLCAYRLGSSVKHGGIATLLLRDGIGYFCAAFGANLLQMVLAALALNPVMNIICLPFALVISTIAATTVFRNVFVLHDAPMYDTTGSGGPTSILSSSEYSARVGAPLPSRRLSAIRFTPGPGGESLILASETDTAQGSQMDVHTVVDVEAGLDHLVTLHGIKTVSVAPALHPPTESTNQSISQSNTTSAGDIETSPPYPY